MSDPAPASSSSGEWKHKGPRVAVDAIVTRANGSEVLLVKRRWPPPGWALPGGFVDLGETVERAVCRETLEETSLVVTKLRQLHAYSDPKRDPRRPSVGIVFEVETTGEPQAGDDAAECRFFRFDALPAEIAFDHRQVLEDFRTRRWPAGLEPAPR